MLRRSFLSGVAVLAATPVFAEGIFNPGANSVGDNSSGALLGSAGNAPPYGKGLPIQDQNLFNILDENNLPIIG